MKNALQNQISVRMVLFFGRSDMIFQWVCMIPEPAMVVGCMKARVKFCREIKPVLARVLTEDSI